MYCREGRIIIHIISMEETNNVKRLYRSRTNRTLAGICGGLGEYWQIDPTILRLLWILLTVFTGFVPGIIAYVLALFIVPERPGEASSSTSSINP